MEANLAEALTWLGKQTTVPWADEFHCGMYREHDLAGAQEVAAGLLARRQDWRDPGPDARELPPTSPPPRHPRSASAGGWWNSDHWLMIEATLSIDLPTVAGVHDQDHAEEYQKRQAIR